ncbi:MAG: Uma2 family endonuclease [Calothrix sp. FI2-JRJ7]|jgi:Uma2 family endonuclease|nr:Uma2 family endonuclease [Calothrix sp. FI2-JRJ7]
MTKTPLQLSFEEYLTYDDGTDNRYELVDGELVMVPLPTGDHSDVIDLLSKGIETAISQQQQPWKVKRDVGVYIGINLKTGRDRSRTPDLTVLTDTQWAVIKADKTRAAVFRTAPLLVVEIVSPGSKKTDYDTKLLEYKNLGIPEYWIVDLKQKKVLILTLLNSTYQVSEFIAGAKIISSTLPSFNLTAQQILSA